MTMAQETFESFYVRDWGSPVAARAARDLRRNNIVKQGGSAGVVRGKVIHRIHREGFEVWYRSGDPAQPLYTRDLRVTPASFENQTAPRLTACEETWNPEPSEWRKNRAA